RVLITQIPVLFQRLPNHLLKRRWNLGVDSSGFYGIAMKDGIGNEAGTGSLKWQLPRGHLVENNAEGKQIRTSIQILCAHLFWGHVSCGSHTYTHIREVIFGFASACGGVL